MTDLTDLDMTTASELGDGFTPLPNGEYDAIVESSERKFTKSGDGEYLQLVWAVVGGQHDGRKIWTRHNLWNKSQKASDIAKAEWRAICEATVDKPAVRDSAEVHSKKCIITVVIEKGQNDQPQNTIVFRKDKIRAYGSAAPKVAVQADMAVKKAPWG